MSFLNSFKITEGSTKEAINFTADLNLMPGIYENGLISVLDKELAETALLGWRWLLGQDAVALAATALGDLFFWSNSQHAVYFLETQKGRSIFIDKEISYFFNDFLIKNEVQEKVLYRQLVCSLNVRLGILSYGECYIAEPWLMLGGTGDLHTYQRGQLDVYLSLTGHAVRKIMDEARNAKPGP